VRITHLESGLVAECRETRSQHQNKMIAFRRLGMLVTEWVKQRYHTQPESSRNEEIVRTYHHVENRVKDHASGFTQMYDEVLDDLTDMIEARATAKNG
jgi:protein subunit release factor A